ncbi:MAG: hypothetical protein M3Q39_03435 [Actinomycetota bacterium]|nr:hypothetical protein [Actinomycetota bacterium]
MTDEELIKQYPLLYHMAWEGTWPFIRDEGLLTTRQLVDICNPPPGVRDTVLARRRPSTVVLTHATHGCVMIRDQAPLREQFLVRSLTDMSVAGWLNVLNSRVFFWLHPDKLSVLLAARLYKKHAHDVIVVDTASLMSAHADRVRLSAVNSGATLYPNAPPRGSGTFLRVQDYPWPERRRRGAVKAITELAVIDGVPDVANHVVRVERRWQGTVLETLFERST